jgi:superfamily I DNA/RNA helicase
VAFDLVVVDEFQDLQPVDARLCLLFSPRRLVLVGDRYQSIYQWRGARCDEVERLSCAAFRRRVDLHLTRSFRCPTVVADVASRLVGNVVVGREDAADSYVRRCSVKEWTQLASEVSENACMMARTWSRLRAMTESLSAEGIPVILDGVKYFRGPQMMMVSGGSDMVSLLRCPRRVGHFKKRNTDDETTDFGRRAVWFELLSVAARNYGRRIESIYATNKKKTVSLTTVHQMKGREVDHAAFWYEDDKAGKNEDEEINIMYTAITRARIGFAFVG